MNRQLKYRHVALDRLIILIMLAPLATPGYARNTAARQQQKPAVPTKAQKDEAQIIIRSMLPHMPEKEIIDVAEPIMAQAWDRFDKKYDERKIRSLVKEFFGLRKVGEPIPLPNPNNVCFMNGAIQALFNIRPLIDFITDNPILFEHNIIASSFLNVFNQMKKGHVLDDTLLNAYDTINPPRITATGKPIYTQGDPDEFMRSLLNAFRMAYDAFMQTGGRAGDFLPDSLFRFQTREIGARRAEDQYELLLAIPQELRSSDQLTLNTLLDHYFAHQTQIIQLPKQLVLLIKRTEIEPTIIEEEIPAAKEKEAKAAAARSGAKKPTSAPTKKQERVVLKPIRLNNRISIPLHLSLQEYIDPSLKAAGGYHLNAAICHLGTGVSGHYVAYIHTSQGDWFYANDMEIEDKSLAEMKDFEKKGFVRENALPYILIYEVDPPALEEKKIAAEKKELPPATAVPEEPLSPKRERPSSPMKALMPSEPEIPQIAPTASVEIAPQPMTELESLKSRLAKARDDAKLGGEAGKKAVMEIRSLMAEIKRLEERAAQEQKADQDEKDEGWTLL